MSVLLSVDASKAVVPEVVVDTLAGRRLRWWWNRFRRTLDAVEPLREEVARDDDMLGNLRCLGVVIL